MAHVIARLDKPTLVISHNKTLAAQLYEEFKELFPDNAVEYFVSYYDYYQPEAYIPQRDIYIEKDASRNDDLDRLRLSATDQPVQPARRGHRRQRLVHLRAGLARRSTRRWSSPSAWATRSTATSCSRSFVDLQYDRNDVDFKRGTFRVRGDMVEIYPAYEEFGYRVEFFGDEVDAIHLINPLTGEVLSDDRAGVHLPGRALRRREEHDRAGRRRRSSEELEQRLIELRNAGKLLEAQRLAARTRVRHGDAAGGRLLPRHRELLAPPGRPVAGRAGPTR